MTVNSMLAKNADFVYMLFNETPPASAHMRTQRGAFFPSTDTIQGPTP
jgi:hypothetical protein